MTNRQLTQLILDNSNLERPFNDLLLKFFDDKLGQYYDYEKMNLLSEEFIDNITGYFRSLNSNIQEYCFYNNFEPDSIAKTMKQGMFFMSTDLAGVDVPLIRHHLYKCIIPLNPDNKFHCHKSIRTAARKMHGMKLTVDRAFSEVINGINGAYEDTWLADKLCAGYAAINKANGSGIYPVNVHSIELSDDKNNLIAGELGFVTGESYVSLSGFHTTNNSGSVQMACLGVLLHKLGFRIWDLGMQIDYKYNYGAIDYDRKAQAEVYDSLSDKPLQLSTGIEYSIDDLLNL